MLKKINIIKKHIKENKLVIKNTSLQKIYNKIQKIYNKITIKIDDITYINLKNSKNSKNENYLRDIENSNFCPNQIIVHIKQNLTNYYIIKCQYTTIYYFSKGKIDIKIASNICKIIKLLRELFNDYNHLNLFYF